MSNIRDVYRPSLATLTDLYELTMAAGYVETGIADREAVFNLTFRARPFHGGYAVAAGLADAIEVLDTLRFAPEDLAHLAALRTADGGALFQPAFLERLETFRFACDVDAIPEGTIVFPHEPLVRIRGPLLQAQLAETMLLDDHRLPDARRDQGGAHRRCRGRRPGARVRAAPRPGRRWRAVGESGGLDRRRRRDIERAGRTAVRHPRARDARAQLGPGVR